MLSVASILPVATLLPVSMAPPLVNLRVMILSNSSPGKNANASLEDAKSELKSLKESNEYKTLRKESLRFAQRAKKKSKESSKQVSAVVAKQLKQEAEKLTEERLSHSLGNLHSTSREELQILFNVQQTTGACRVGLFQIGRV